jgi:hypothetical protein
MFEEEEKKLKRLLLQVKQRTSLKKLTRLTVHFEGTEGDSALPLACNCHAPRPHARSQV